MKQSKQKRWICDLADDIMTKRKFQVRNWSCVITARLEDRIMKMIFKRMAVEMLQVAEGKLEAHEYLNALKAGELHEFAAFAEQFASIRPATHSPKKTNKNPPIQTNRRIFHCSRISRRCLHAVFHTF